MLDIPTARTNLQARRTARQQPAAATAPQTGLGTQPGSAGGPGMTSLAAPMTPPTTAPAAAPTQPSMGANEYIASKMGGYDWRGRQDEITKYLGEYNAQGAQTGDTFNGITTSGVGGAGPQTRWSSSLTQPGTVEYNPGTEGAEWSPVTSESLSDPDILSAVQRGATGPFNPSTGFYQELMRQAPPPPAPTGAGGITYGPLGYLGASGSQHNLSPEVMNKMWR